MAIKEALTIAYDFQKLGLKAGFFKYAEELYTNPALMKDAENICILVQNSIYNWNQEVNGNSWDYSTRMTFTMRFCFYFGIGAYCLWDKTGKSYQPLSLIEVLSKPRGFDCIDEYAIELLDIKYGTEKSKRIDNHVVYDLIPKLGAYSTQVYSDGDVVKQIIECMKGIYDYGIMFARSYLMSK